MNNHKLLEKAYEIDLMEIEDGYFLPPIYVYAETLAKAKKLLLEKITYEYLKLKYSDDEITFKNIPVIRSEKLDLFEFEGNKKTLSQIEDILDERKRIQKLDNMLNNPEIRYCYILKQGLYYRSNRSGYAEHKAFAGVYEIEDAVDSCKRSRELRIIPINIEEHNKMLQDKIDDLKSRLIK